MWCIERLGDLFAEVLEDTNAVVVGGSVLVVASVPERTGNLDERGFDCRFLCGGQLQFPTYRGIRAAAGRGRRCAGFSRKIGGEGSWCGVLFGGRQRVSSVLPPAGRESTAESTGVRANTSTTKTIQRNGM
ncbi:MAG: hypothetical protein U0992_02735 [Planctomycetaceae bacterium]